MTRQGAEGTEGGVLFVRAEVLVGHGFRVDHLSLSSSSGTVMEGGGLANCSECSESSRIGQDMVSLLKQTS